MIYLVQRKFREVPVEWQGEAVFVGDFNLKIEKASNSNEEHWTIWGFNKE